MFKELPSPHEFPQLELEILAFWEKNDIFHKSVNSRDPEKLFVFYEGPPTANGKPGIHHVISRAVKDFVCRLRTMQGYRVERKAGWDTHGLPVEIEVEKELGIEGKEQIIEYGIAKFNEKCKENVFRYKAEWDELTRRIAFWVDLDDPYITYSNEYIESVWWILKEFWQKGLLYEGHKVLPYCPRCETALSSHEVSLGYKDVPDPSIFVKMKLKEAPDTYFLIWTTTPWTLISNAALAVHPDETYVKIRLNGEKLILVKQRLSVIEGDYEIIEEIKGRKLENIEYDPLFSFIKPDKKAWYVILGDFVTTEEGTGIVHTAPAFGEDDYRMGQKYNLPFLQPVDKSGRFTEEITDFKQQFVKDADKDIIKNIKQRGLLYHAEICHHSYPFCWRCDSPLLYYAKESWFIRTTKLKENLLANNKKIQWIPKEVGEGRFGEWLRNNVDWTLSRDRFWGTPLNIWKCTNCDFQLMIGSMEELSQKSNLKEIPDLHKPYIDDVEIPCEKCQTKMKRVPEVIDVWFDSGAMPYAQWHYPFENQDIFKRNFPADFISEGIDQTRGWFYSLLAISTLLFDEPAYKACVSLELILDQNGQKMSKSKGNTVDPFEIIEQFGVDPLRWYFFTVSPPWTPTKFDPEGIKEVQRKFFGTLINTYSFFVMYANIDGFQYTEDGPAIENRPEMDLWILSARNRLVGEVNEFLQRYDLTKAARAISDFTIEELSNWYVRRSRRRFWKNEMGDDKISAYKTLYEVLLTLSKLIAPFAPFIADALYRNLNTNQTEPYESVHLAFYPDQTQREFSASDEELLSRMEITRNVVSVARALRSAAGMKVRQPLKKIVIAVQSEKQRNALCKMQGLILEEINVKTIEFLDNPDDLAILKAKGNFKSLGPKFGKDVNKVVGQIEKLKHHEILALQENNEYDLSLGNGNADITLEDVIISTENPPDMVVQIQNNMAVGLNLKISESLKQEGFAREFVNRVQNMRKEHGLEVVDRININVDAPEEFIGALSNWESYIKNETLAENLDFKIQNLDYSKDWKIDGQDIKISISGLKFQGIS
ncbi:isoleucine--tRNA ligase [candidate division KSB1 bacterium]|nr:isoleucine--tRNA ligase [candidate division KSB1 bacterium]